MPPIDELEQRSHWSVIGEGRVQNRIFVATGDVYKPVGHGPMKRSDFKDKMEAKWGAPFMVELP